MKQTFLKNSLLLFITLLLANCEKEELPTGQESNIETVGIEEAINLFSTSKNVISKSISEGYVIPYLNQITHEQIVNSNELLTVIPAKINNEKFYSRILLLKIDGEIKSVVFNMIPDNESTTDEFYGKIFLMDIEGNFFSGYKVEKNIIISQYQKSSNDKSKNNSKSLSSKSSECPYEDKELCSLNEIVIVANKPSRINYLSLPQLFRDGGGNYGYAWDSSGGGGSGSSSTGCSSGHIKDSSGNCVVAISLDLTNTSKIDPHKELKCFDLTKGAKLTVYVQQPRENTSDVMGPNSVGHAFIGIEQDGIIRQLGFYPMSGANSALVAIGKNYVSELRNNNDYLYHVSISKNISISQLNSITDYIKNFPSTYNVNNYACTDFAIKIGNLSGMNLPSTTVNNLTFSGRSPGQLGQEIRAMSSDNNKTISKTKNNSPKSRGKCL